MKHPIHRFTLAVVALLLAATLTAVAQPSAERCADRTGTYTSLVITDADQLSADSALVTIGGGGGCYGWSERPIRGDLALAIWQDNPATPEQDGAALGEPLTLAVHTDGWSNYYDLPALDGSDPVYLDAYDYTAAENAALRAVVDEQALTIDSLRTALAAAPEPYDPPGLSDRQIRQFLGYQRAQINNLKEAADEALARLQTVEESIQQRIDAQEGP